MDINTCQCSDESKKQVQENNTNGSLAENTSTSSSETGMSEEKMDRQEFILIWLDQNLDTGKRDLRNLTALRSVVDFLQTFTNVDSCCEFIKKILHSNVYLIVSGTTGRKAIPLIHDWAQIKSIYVLCRSKETQESWTASYTKICSDSIFTNVNYLIDRLRSDLYRCQNVSGISYNLERSIIDVNSKVKDFQWSHHLILTLVSWPRNPVEQNKMVLHMRKFYGESQPIVEFLEKFTKEYSSTDAIKWYKHSGCLFRSVNRAFRSENIDEIFFYRLFIKDLSEQIILLHHELQQLGQDEYTLYRGTCLSYQDISILKANRGRLISFNGFLSTSLSRDVALLFVQPSNEQEQIEATLFEFYVKCNLDTPAYAYIGNNSIIPDELEVLFDIGAVFRIESTKYDSSMNFWCVRCVLCAKQEIPQFHIKEPSTIPQDALRVLHCGQVLVQMGNLKRGAAFFNGVCKIIDNDVIKVLCLLRLTDLYQLLNDRSGCIRTWQEIVKHSSVLGDMLSNDDDFRISYYRRLGFSFLSAGRFDDAFECFAISLSLIAEDDTIESRKHLAKTLAAIGQGYTQCDAYLKAKECYMEEAKLAEETYTNSMEQGEFYERLGTVSIQLKDFGQALDYFGKACDHYYKILPSYHPKWYTLNNTIALIYLYQGHLDTALEYFTIDLDILSQKSELKAITLAIYTNIGRLYYLKNELDLSVMYYEKAIALQLEQSNTAFHPNLITMYIQLAFVLRRQLKHEAAENFLQKACVISEKRSMPLKTAECFAMISEFHVEKENITDAFLYMAKALCLRKRVCGEYDAIVATTYRELGAIWLRLGNHEVALKLITRAMMIFTLSTSTTSLEFATNYFYLGSIYLACAEYLLAVKYFRKAMKIRKMYLAENHPEIGAIHHRLGTAYALLLDFNTALRYSYKSLAAGGERCAIIEDMAEMYRLQNKHDQALEFYEKALNETKLKYGGDHVKTVKLYSKIADSYYNLKEYILAAEYFVKSLNYYENNTVGTQALIVEYLIKIAKVFSLARKYDIAIDYLERGMKYLPQNDPQLCEIRKTLACNYQLLGDKLREDSNFPAALTYYERALEIWCQWYPSEIDEIKTVEYHIEQTKDIISSSSDGQSSFFLGENSLNVTICDNTKDTSC